MRSEIGILRNSLGPKSSIFCRLSSGSTYTPAAAAPAKGFNNEAIDIAGNPGVMLLLVWREGMCACGDDEGLMVMVRIVLRAH